jgi:hypothetical protein
MCKNILFINKTKWENLKNHIERNSSSGKPPSDTGLGKHKLSPINR